jgi:signal peptidase I
LFEAKQVSTHIEKPVASTFQHFAATPSEKRVSTRRLVLSLLLLLPLTVVWAGFLSGDLRSFKVVSASMVPTLGVGDFVVMRHDSRAQDLHNRPVVFYNPRDTDELLTKRVIATEGDIVRIENGRLSVNGKPEPDIHPSIKHVRDRYWIVREGEVFVVGDNRNNSFDSIDYGPIKEESVQGVLTFRYWPLSRFGRVQ